MKTKNSIVLILILAIVISASYIAINGTEINDYKISSARDSIDLGLDLAGGVFVVLEAQTDATGAELQKIMNQSKAIINERVNGLGISDPNIAIEGNKRLRIELAGVEDPQEAIDLIGKTAQLQFIEANGDVVITGKNVKDTNVAFQPNSLGVDEPVVTLELDKEGTKSFAEATGRLTLEENPEDRIIFIVLDEQIISSPAVQSKEEGGGAITDGKAVISGNFDPESAKELSTLIRAGALPVEMIEHQTSVIGPTLGLESFDTSIKAGGIALLIIFLFMLLVYKIPGVVAAIGLTVYTLIILFTMILLNVKLTLPGIAGLILSIGMAVDSNILIFERIREELLIGKTIRSSIDSGFRRALSSVIDSNITTLIAGVVLYYFGIGPIKGFGVTLTIGILASLITSVLFTKYLLRIFSKILESRNSKIYGA